MDRNNKETGTKMFKALFVPRPVHNVRLSWYLWATRVCMVASIMLFFVGSRTAKAEEYTAMPMSQSEIERELRSLQQKVNTYEDILKEMRQSEQRAQHSDNRLLSTVQWALGTAIAVTLAAIVAVVGLNWWINDKVYSQDKQVLRSDLINTVKDEIKNLGGSHTTSMKDQFGELQNELSKMQSSSYANAFLQLADMRQSLFDLEGALMNAIVAFGKGTESGPKDWIPALERMDTAIRRATMGQKRLPIMLIGQVHNILTQVDRMSSQNPDQAIKLKETLKAHEALPSP